MATIENRNGTYRVKVRRAGYPPISATFDTLALAQAFARKAEHQMDERSYRMPVKGTVGELFDKYAKQVSPTKKGERWEVIRLNRLKKEVGRTLLTEVQRGTNWLRTWRDARLEVVAGSSINRELNLISAVFTHAIQEWNFPGPNPVKSVKRPKNPPARQQRLDDAFIAGILERAKFDESTAPATAKSYVPWVFLLALETAMRLGEVLRLKWVDVHLDESWCKSRDNKNGYDRDVPLTPRAVELLSKLPRTDIRVFPVKPGTFDVYWRAVRPKGFRFHDSRHEATTRLAGKLSNVLELAAVTGHRDLRSLKVYFNPTAQELALKISGGAQPDAVSPHASATTPAPLTLATVRGLSPEGSAEAGGGVEPQKG